MAQQTLTNANEGAFDYSLRSKVNANFTDLYNRATPARQSADVVVDESTTLTNLTGLVATLAVGTYKFRVALQCLATANGGTKVAFVYATPTSIQCEAKAFTASAVAVTRFTTTTSAASIVAATAANICIELEGTIVVATAGTIQVQGAQNVSHADETTYYAGSTLEVYQIA